MPRTAKTLAITHDGKDELLYGKTVSLITQKEKLRAFRGLRVHEKYQEVSYQESDGHEQVYRFITPELHAKRLKQNEADQKAFDAAEQARAGTTKPAAKPAVVLLDNGPTVAEYAGRGYNPANYPSDGYASKSSAEEIAAAIANYNQAADDKEAAAELPNAEGLRKDLLQKSHSDLLKACAELAAANPEFKLPAKTSKLNLVNALVSAGYQPPAA